MSNSGRQGLDRGGGGAGVEGRRWRSAHSRGSRGTSHSASARPHTLACRIDPESGSPRRRVARKSEIPEEARPLIDLLVEQRLLSTDVAQDTGEVTIEPAHEALLRQWGLLQGWLEEDFGCSRRWRASSAPRGTGTPTSAQRIGWRMAEHDWRKRTHLTSGLN